MTDLVGITNVFDVASPIAPDLAIMPYYDNVPRALITCAQEIPETGIGQQSYYEVHNPRCMVMSYGTDTKTGEDYKQPNIYGHVIISIKVHVPWLLQAIRSGLSRHGVSISIEGKTQ